MRTKLASEASAPKHCYKHKDRVATHVRIEHTTKPIPQTRRVPACDDCAFVKPKRAEFVTSATARKI